MNGSSNNIFSKRFFVVIFVIISLLCIMFFAAISRFNAPLFNRIAVTTLAPFQSVASAVSSKFSAFGNYVTDVFYVYDQNRELQAQNDDLKMRASQAAELESENARLRQLLDYKNTHTQYKLLPATVIGRNSSNWSSHLIINRGTDDGVQKNMTVITPDGLVGNIYQAYGSYSEVELITDPRSAVGAIVQRADSRVSGVVKGTPDSSSSITMNNLAQNANVVEGDVITTSGLGGIYPKGIPIGTVTALKNDTGGLLQYAVLYPNVDFQKLEDVAIITNYHDIITADNVIAQQQAAAQQAQQASQQQAQQPQPQQAGEQK